MEITRRDFVRAAAGAAALGVSGAAVAEPAEEPPTLAAPAHPVVISSGNGEPACRKAMELLQAGGDPLDAVVAGVTLVEDDPSDHSVGYGGLPNEDGEVELDASVMHGPTARGGAVAALRRIRNPAQVARVIMRRTDHVLIVGEGALRFAKAHGFKEQDLLTDEAREIWLKWKESHSPNDDWLYPEADVEARRRLRDKGIEFTRGTITCLAVTTAGDLGGCTSTSGLSYKIPGRVGDSPILGAGLFVDNEVGACGSTGRGESNLVSCSSCLIVERMRAGLTPEAACREVLQRIERRTERRLRDAEGHPAYGLTFYALRKDGLFGGATMRGKAKLAVQDSAGFRFVQLDGFYAALPE